MSKDLDQFTISKRFGVASLDEKTKRIWIGRLRDNVPFIAITLVIILFWFIYGECSTTS